MCCSFNHRITFIIYPSPHSDNNESEYFSETLAAESLPHYQPAPPPAKDSPSPTSPYSSVDSTNHVNNNGQSAMMTPSQQINLINNNPKYHQPPIYNNNGTHTNGNNPPQLVRSNVVLSAAIPSGGGAGGGVSNASQMQQQLQQKYYDQYENYARPNPSSNGNGVNGNGVNNNQHQNGMSQSVYNGTKGYASQPPQQMTASYNQQMSYNNHYNSHQNGSSNVGKIADYDPLTDGPRNAPQTARTNQTLIYSSDRAARKCSDSIIVFFLAQLFAHKNIISLVIVQQKVIALKHTKFVSRHFELVFKIGIKILISGVFRSF